MTRSFRSRYARAALPAALMLGAATYSVASETSVESAVAAAQPFSAGKILHVVQTLNNGEVMQAQAALDKSGNSEVRGAAQMIVDDHTASNQQIASMAQQRNVELEPNALSRHLEAHAKEVRDKLAKLSGKEFDCAFLHKQAKQHALALETVRKQLRPDSEEAAVRDFLDKTAASLERHQQAAERGKSSLQCKA